MARAWPAPHHEGCGRGYFAHPTIIGLFAPARTPGPIVGQIAQATRAAMADQDFQQAFIASGFEPYVDSSPEKAARFVEDEIARWSPIIKAIGLKLE